MTHALGRHFPGERDRAVTRAERVLSGRRSIAQQASQLAADPKAAGAIGRGRPGGWRSDAPPSPLRACGITGSSVPLTDAALEDCDVVVIATDHGCIDYARIVARAPLVVDTRDACRAVTVGREKIVKS